MPEVQMSLMNLVVSKVLLGFFYVFFNLFLFSIFICNREIFEYLKQEKYLRSVSIFFRKTHIRASAVVRVLRARTALIVNFDEFFLFSILVVAEGGWRPPIPSWRSTEVVGGLVSFVLT